MAAVGDPARLLMALEEGVEGERLVAVPAVLV